MEELLSGYSQNNLSVGVTLFNLAAGLLLGLLLKFHYERFGSVMSGKRELAKILPFLILIVCLIISIVKSSLALSLGLVGALSIVRFRTPIKEPEELAYLFMAIAIGLGLGANQLLVTVLATLCILASISLVRWRFYRAEEKALYLLIEIPSDSVAESGTAEIIEAVTSHTHECELKRFDKRNGDVTATFLIDIKSAESALKMADELSKGLPGSSVTLLDQSRIPGV